MLVTDYQLFQSSWVLTIIQQLENMVEHHIYPVPNTKYFKYWKDFLLNKISNEKIEIIYTINPLEGEKLTFLKD